MKLTAYEKSLRQTQRRLWKALNAAPLVTLVGLITPTGPGGGMSRGEKLYTFSIELKPWRVKGGEVDTRELRVLQLMTERQLDAAMKQFAPYQIVELRARLATHPETGLPVAALVKTLRRNAKDTALTAEKARLQKPHRVKDPVLGTLTLDRRTNALEGKVRWCGKLVQVSVDAATDSEQQESLATAKKLWKQQRLWSKRLCDGLCKHLLKLANEWEQQAADDEERPAKPFTASTFLRRLRLTTVVARPRGEFSYWFDDGDTFCGHAISASGSLTEGILEADIQG